MAAVCTTGLTNAKAIHTFSFRNIPGAPGNDLIIDEFVIESNVRGCELTITDMSNCNVIVISSNLNDSPITIYSPGSYNLTFTNGLNDSCRLMFIPINQNLPSFCYGYVTI